MAQQSGNRIVGWIHVQATYLLECDARAEIWGLVVSEKARGSGVGRRLVEAERALDMAFASKRADPSSLTAMIADIGQLAAKLREEHLRTHLMQTALLDAAQVQSYAQLRGYEASSGTQAPAAAHRAHKTPAQRTEGHLPEPGRAHSGH